MALVDFTRIPQTAFSPTDNLPIMQCYDPLWGFITVSQTIEFKYEKESKYRSFGTIIVKGVFTLNATYQEVNGDPEGDGTMLQPDPALDEDRFNLLKAKYVALRDMFAFAGRQSPPSNIGDYGTSADPRCVRLPGSLMDSDGNPIYMRPASLNIDETQWPSLISYTATMKEIPPIPCKLAVNGHIIDRGVLTINARKPMLKTVEYAFASSSDIFFDGWQSRSYSVQGSLAEVPPSGMLVPPSGTKDFLDVLMTGIVTIGKNIPMPHGINPSGIPPSGIDPDGFIRLVPDVFVDSSSVVVSQETDGRGIKINFSARE